MNRFIATLRLEDSTGIGVQEFETELSSTQILHILDVNPVGLCRMLFEYDSFGDEDSLEIFPMQLIHIPAAALVKLRLTE